MSWQYSVGELVERYITEMGEPGMRPVGVSQKYTLRAVGRSRLGEKNAGALKKSDVIDYCRELRARICPATINQHVSYLNGVLKYAGAAWEDCEDVSGAAITAAKPFLVKHGLISKSTPRNRVPTEDEEARLLDYFKAHDQNPRVTIKMVPMILFALASSRRISEICRIQHGDIDWGRKDDKGNPTPMYMVRDLKHPTKKQGNNKWFPLLDPMPEIIRMMPRLTPEAPDERVFPYNAKSAGASYTEAKKQLGIVNLRFHDNRRLSITRWLAVFKSPHKVKLISGHETTQILERVYDATDPSSLHQEYANVRPSA